MQPQTPVVSNLCRPTFDLGPIVCLINPIPRKMCPYVTYPNPYDFDSSGILSPESPYFFST